MSWHLCWSTSFFPSPGKWMKASCHDKVIRMASKKQGTSASADSPIDSVPEEQNSPGGKILKSGFMFSFIDFGGRL